MKYKMIEAPTASLTNNELLDKVLAFNGIKEKKDLEKIETSVFPIHFYQEEMFFERINKAKNNHENVCIIGDYDTDGITATTILFLFLKRMDIDCQFLIGDRFIDGYGMNNSLVDQAIANKANLIITVDNGIKCRESIAYATKRGVDVIVTDHHQIEEKALPQNVLIYNPHLKENNLDFEDYCGAMTIFQLIYNYFKSDKCLVKSDKELIYTFYQLAGIATIADVMPLYYFNRKLVGIIINQFKKGEFYSKALEVIFKKTFDDLEDISSTSIAFKIVPLLNAPGRLSDSSVVVKMLLANDLEEIIKLYDKCVSINEERKIETKKGLDILVNETDYVNVCFSPAISEGVIGIVAGNIKERTLKPTFVFTRTQDGEIKGSARSFGEYDILAETIKVANKDNTIIKQYGGHQAALGVTLYDMNSLVKFKKIINEEYPKLNIEEPVSYYLDVPKKGFKMIYDDLRQLEPIGQGMEIPPFLIKGKPLNLDIKKNCHSFFSMEVNSVKESFVLFNQVVNDDVSSFLFSIEKSTFNGRTSYKGMIRNNLK